MLVNIQSELDRLCVETGTVIKYNEPMANHTSLKIGGRAQYFIEAGSLDFMSKFLKYRSDDAQMFALGGGSNILFSDQGYDGYIICTKGLGQIREIGDLASDEIMIEAEAGVMLQGLLKYVKDRGYTGIEGLSGIPGTVGGAVYGNAGSYGCEIGGLVREVTVINKDGVIRDISKNADTESGLTFRYRGSNISEDALIISTKIALKRDSSERVTDKIKEIFEKKKASQPIDQRSAGCVFKNPQGDYAGRLIEQSGCKGLNNGGIFVSNTHANFFINKGGGSCNDFLILMDKVKEIVFKNFGVELEPEIKIVTSGNVRCGRINL
ncbi:MAG: UDP-N-acetylmuramate dehydrogenase [Nitrospirae bacterium]|nr:UDP-N-acetylmuramate dehydrogenase [Nitrospirota bacterium]